MPKIIKNGRDYSGVPLECVTAWQPTGDPVQVAEPLMGNTDISDIGDGTITGAVSALNAGLTSYTEGIWKVRKYPDGTAECWGMTTISTNITSAWGSLFINAENSISFPSGLFIAMPVINITAGGLNNSIPFIAETTTKDELTYRVLRPTSQTVASVTVHAHAIGRWK